MSDASDCDDEQESLAALSDAESPAALPDAESPAALFDALRSEARATDQRRLLVVHGERERCLAAVRGLFDDTRGDTGDSVTTDGTAGDSVSTDRATGDSVTTDRATEDTSVAVVSENEAWDDIREGTGAYERHAATDADRLMGTTHEVVVFDGFAGFAPNAVGRTVGAVAGGGVYVLLLPPLEAWTSRVDDFRRSLAVPPFTAQDVSSAFRERFVETLQTHPGVGVYDAEACRVERDGVTGQSRQPPRSSGTLPSDPDFPLSAYAACLTADQGRSLRALERLQTPGSAVVVEADRGRGKSSVAGLAAASLAAAGEHVAVTAPAPSNAATLFARAADLLTELEDNRGAEPTGEDGQFDSSVDADDQSAISVDADDQFDSSVDADDLHLSTAAGGSVEYVPPSRLDEWDDQRADVVVVDEAAALPVERLSGALAAPSVAYVTTVHGYEGAGRGFSVRFRERLADATHTVTETTLSEPIRHAPADPVESWAFRALALDARPAVDQLVAEGDPETATYRRLSTAALREDEHLLRETFGLLVLAHYQTEPTDLARLLDAPNLTVHALLVEGHVAAVALVAREGGLSAARRADLFRGARIRGNMIPDLLTGQLRDPDAGRPVGYRIVRIATHHAVRRSGFGSRLLAATRADLADGIDDRERFVPADYLGSGFGATPGVVDFWRANGYRTVHLSTTRNDASGEHSAVVIDPVTADGQRLFERHSRGFRDRIGGVLADTLRDLDPDVVRATLRACGADPGPLTELSDYEWRMVVGASTGPGLYATAPRPFRQLAVAWFLDDGQTGEYDSEPAGDEELTAREERLLVRKVLQAQPWDEVATELDYVSTGECMRALGSAYVTVVDRLGDETARRERERYER